MKKKPLKNTKHPEVFTVLIDSGRLTMRLLYADHSWDNSCGKITHWLEEKQNVFVLNEDELRQLIVDAVFEHKNTTIDKFLESKLKQP